MSRPYGCGEQTISSTYPSLLLLRNVKNAGQDSALRNLAQKYLRAGYSRLLNYRHENGGFTYWGRGEPDLEGDQSRVRAGRPPASAGGQHLKAQARGGGDDRRLRGWNRRPGL